MHNRPGVAIASLWGKCVKYSAQIQDDCSYVVEFEEVFGVWH